jgi:hypothetical protein
MKRTLCYLSLVAAVCVQAGPSFETPKQFQVWGTTVPEQAVTIKVKESLKEVFPVRERLRFEPTDNGQAGFYPYNTNTVGRMHYLRTPTPAELMRPQIKSFLAWGEYEPATLGIYALKEQDISAE